MTAIKNIFNGYSSESKGYCVYVPKSKKVLATKVVIFAENAVQ